MALEQQILLTIKRQAGNVILRADVAGLGSASQVSKVLRTLQEKGVLVRISTGVYAKTKTSSVTGTTVPAGSLETLASETLKRLGISLGMGRAAADYNANRTTQLPGAFVVNTERRRISRKITVGGRSLLYENNYSRSKEKASVSEA